MCIWDMYFCVVFVMVFLHGVHVSARRINWFVFRCLYFDVRLGNLFADCVDVIRGY